MIVSAKSLGVTPTGFKGWLARLLGLESKIREVNERVHQMSVDPAFNVYTRPALMWLADHQPRGDRLVLFLDFDDIHRMNSELGYEEVNRRVRKVFETPIRTGDLVGRWFSGDEIVIVFDCEEGGVPVLSRLRKAAGEVGLRFTAAVGGWAVGEDSLESVVERLIPTVLREKELRRTGGQSSARSRVLLSEAV